MDKDNWISVELGATVFTSHFVGDGGGVEVGSW